MTIPNVITIDGPAGAGKSTLGELLAHRLGYMYFDTGIMYRALTLAALHQGIDPHAGDAVTELARRLDIEVQPPTVDDGRQYTVLVNGEDVTWHLRAPEVEKHVSAAARHPDVRAIMRARQREIGMRGHVVMVGRDIGSVVMPDSALKVFLKASLEERARRRAQELRARGQQVTPQELRADMERRDKLDQHVMMPAPDAVILDCDNLSPEQEAAFVESLLKTHVAE